VLRDLLDISMIQSTIRMATPVLLAAMGAMVTSAAGIINISLEGTMLLSAFFAVVGSYFFSSVWMGLLIGVGTGMLVALLFGVFSLRFRAHIILMGIAINAFANAFTIYMLRSMFKVAGAFSDPRIVGFDQVHIPIIKDIPVLGPIVSGYAPIVYVAWLLVIVMHIFLYRTPAGVHLRAIGENEEAAESLGINVERVKLLAVLLSGLFASLAGVYLSLGHLTMFTENMSANRGFVGLAANIFGRGTPIGGALASLIFGFADALAMRLQGTGGIPSQLVLMFPSVLTIGILLMVAIKLARDVQRTKLRNVEKALSE
jgi:ABC-type uncharacterized transport system permease subunit